MIKFSFIALILLASLWCVKCTKSEIPHGGYPVSIYISNFTFFLQDPSGKPLIGDFNSMYTPDVIKITNYEGIDSVNYKITGDGLIQINPSNITDKVGIDLEKYFLIHFPASVINASEDIDTININYNLINQNSTLWYDTISVYYNQKLIYKGQFPLEHLKIRK
jgi:hypothetical protein